MLPDGRMQTPNAGEPPDVGSMPEPDPRDSSVRRREDPLSTGADLGRDAEAGP